MLLTVVAGAVLAGIALLAYGRLRPDADRRSGCPVVDVALCSLALRLEAELQARETTTLLAQIAWQHECGTWPAFGRRDCTNLSDVYYVPGCNRAVSHCWQGDGNSVIEESLKGNVERWLARTGPVRLYGVGLGGDGSPRSLLYTADGSADDRRPDPSLFFILLQRDGAYLIEATVTAPRQVVLDGLEAWGSGQLEWLAWLR
jgi:hypothetical protein